MAEILLPLLFLAVGITGLYFSVKFLTDPIFAKRHIKTSPKTWLLVKALGIKKATAITKKILMPLGIVISFVFIALGIVFLI